MVFDLLKKAQAGSCDEQKLCAVVVGVIFDLNKIATDHVPSVLSTFWAESVDSATDRGVSDVQEPCNLGLTEPWVLSNDQKEAPLAEPELWVDGCDEFARSKGIARGGERHGNSDCGWSCGCRRLQGGLTLESGQWVCGLQL